MMIYANITYYFTFNVDHISFDPQFYLFGSGSVMPLLPTILMSAVTQCFIGWCSPILRQITTEHNITGKVLTLKF